MAFDKEKLFEDNREYADVEVPPHGTFRIRALSRAEALQISSSKGTADIERKMISWACVEPKLTYQDVERWQKSSSAMVLEPLSDAIARISGMDEQAEKSAVARFPEESGN